MSGMGMRMGMGMGSRERDRFVKFCNDFEAYRPCLCCFS